MVAYLKDQVGGKNLSDSELADAIDQASEKFNVSLTHDQIDQLKELLKKLQGLDLNWNNIRDQAENLYGKLKDMGLKVDTSALTQQAQGFFAKLIAFIKACLTVNGGNMEAYTEFAQVYDRFMDNVPYEAWCEGISKILTEHGISEGLVLDLGCGTGTMTRLLRQKGYDMIGVDASAEMLEIARNHPDEGILYLQPHMREFELYTVTVAAVVCVCDSLNYLLEEEVFSVAGTFPGA